MSGPSHFEDKTYLISLIKEEEKEEKEEKELTEEEKELREFFKECEKENDGEVKGATFEDLEKFLDD